MLVIVNNPQYASAISEKIKAISVKEIVDSLIELSSYKNEFLISDLYQYLRNNILESLIIELLDLPGLDARSRNDKKTDERYLAIKEIFRPLNTKIDTLIKAIKLVNLSEGKTRQCTITRRDLLVKFSAKLNIEFPLSSKKRRILANCVIICLLNFLTPMILP